MVSVDGALSFQLPWPNVLELSLHIQFIHESYSIKIYIQNQTIFCSGLWSHLGRPSVSLSSVTPLRITFQWLPLQSKAKSLWGRQALHDLHPISFLTFLLLQHARQCTARPLCLLNSLATFVTSPWFTLHSRPVSAQMSASQWGPSCLSPQASGHISALSSSPLDHISLTLCSCLSPLTEV